MTADLYQLVDLTRPEADGIKGFVEVDDTGRHRLPLFESDSPCEKCRDEAEIVETADGPIIEPQTTYTIPARGSPPLCRDHLMDQPYHIGFKPADNGGGSR